MAAKSKAKIKTDLGVQEIQKKFEFRCLKCGSKHLKVKIHSEYETDVCFIHASFTVTCQECKQEADYD